MEKLLSKTQEVTMNNIPASKKYEVALKTVHKILAEWKFSKAEQEGLLRNASLTRLSRILNVYSLLRTMFSPERSAAWLRAENEHFGGHTASYIILRNENGIETVQKYLNLAYK
ncbi:MAG: hypothetical protein ACI92E_001335 [Oceanicoccus sp.]